MDQQKPNTAPAESEAPRRVLTEAEIARAEAEAVAARQRARADAPEAPKTPADFVPYVDDVPDAKADFVPYVDDAPEAEPDGDDEPCVPGEWEKRIAALPPRTWKLWQIAGGAVVGLAAMASLFAFGEELSMYGLVVAALLALLLPRYLERAWNVRLTTARYAMVVAMLAGLIAVGVVVGLRTGFVLTKPK